MSEHAEMSRIDPPIADTETQLGPPPSPESVAEVGVRQGILEDLTLKILYLNGSLSLRELSSAMRLGFGVVNELLRRLRAEQLCEVTGMTGNIPQIAITTAGRGRALELLAQNQYAGPAPVSLESYVRRVKQQSVRDTEIHPPDVQRAFSHLVLEPITLKKLGAALNSGTSIFLYGPSGTGKTTIASALSNVVSLDRIWVPYAVDVDGQIITVYDPHVHSSTDQPDSSSHDARWVLCNRPTVLVGGELTIEMLELQLNPITKFYTAPLQMKSNNGVLIIDDFGRQRVRPDELLNRWVVPLDRRIDFLSLAGGKKVEIPFEMFVVFATNLDPATLVDAAFLRRIQTKIEVGTLSPEHFTDIFHAVAKEFKMEYTPEMINDLIDVIRNKFREPLRACHPRDIINQIRWAARYEQTDPVLDHKSIMEAVAVYFVSDSSQ
jgi:predicted ATPase with chaperone activity